MNFAFPCSSMFMLSKKCSTLSTQGIVRCRLPSKVGRSAFIWLESTCWTTFQAHGLAFSSTSSSRSQSGGTKSLSQRVHSLLVAIRAILGACVTRIFTCNASSISVSASTFLDISCELLLMSPICCSKIVRRST